MASKPVAALVLASVLSTCSAPIPPPSVQPTPSSSAVAGLPLPTLHDWPFPSDGVACGGEYLESPLTLEGNPSDGVYAQWGNRRLPTQWPPGYVATFTPDLVVYAPSGDIVAHAGTDLNQPRVGNLLPCTSAGGVDFLPVAGN
jgi:hypothetical protein